MTSAPIALAVDGDRLNYSGPSEMVEAALPYLREHKLELIEMIRVGETPDMTSSLCGPPFSKPIPS